MPTSTTNYSLSKPLVGSATDEDLWGTELNSDLDSIDTLLKSGITIATQASQTTGFTADVSISVKKLYPCDATASAFSATLPAAATAGNGATVYIKKSDSTSHAVTITPDGGETIDSASTLPLVSKDDCYGLVSDGVSNWNTICEITNIAAATPVLQHNEFTSSGNFTAPASTVAGTVFKFTVTGGGGGGSGGITAGAGGGAGGTAIYYASGLTALSNYAVTVGAAGTAGSSAGGAGGNGGNSTVVIGATTITGGGGTGGAIGSNAPVGGAGGTATNGTVNIPGGSGTVGIWSAQMNGGGTGGASIWGGGGTGGSTAGATSTGAAGVAYGSGGGGGCGGAGVGAGGAGKAGVVTVEWIL